MRLRRKRRASQLSGTAEPPEGSRTWPTTAPLVAFLKATTLHIGAAAAAASLRHDLAEGHRVAPHDIDAAYAVSRITPGTNLLAMYALLGHRLGGWPLAVQAVAVGALVPAVAVVLIAFLYTEYASPALAAFMAGARAGGVAVLLGAAIRLLKPQLAPCPRLGLGFTLAAFVIAWVAPVSLFVVLLVAAGSGALLLRPTS